MQADYVFHEVGGELEVLFDPCRDEKITASNGEECSSLTASRICSRRSVIHGTILEERSLVGEPKYPRYGFLKRQRWDYSGWVPEKCRHNPGLRIKASWETQERWTVDV